MKFDELKQNYASNRYCITANNGMVATGSALASAAGLEILKKGGNAVDAAVATAAALTVVEPTANGLGSDAFALVWIKDELHGLNASGYSPYDITLEDVKKRVEGDQMPTHGWLPVMVPGAVKGWATLVQRFGKLTLAEDLAPAIAYAENGYPLSPLLAKMWERSTDIFNQRFAGKKEFDEWFKTFTKNGESYHFGEVVKLPNHARTLRLIAETNADAYYKGEIADQFVRQSQANGGYFSKRDLEEYECQWVDPISVHYHGYDVHEIPPNGQGIAALMALNTLKEFDLKEKDCGETYHKEIEAMKMAFADAFHSVTDPSCMKVDYHEYLKPEYGKRRAAEIKENAQNYGPVDLSASGTVYLCTADGEGNMVSYIQSNYMGFGSGIVLEGYGVSLQNRGADFSLNENDVNVLAPHKKTYHTIIPGFLTKDGKAVGPFGVMGGYMQPQGHLQVVTNMIDFHMNPQMALDAPRWQWNRDGTVSIEKEAGEEIIEELRRRGHDIKVMDERTSFGRGEIIIRLNNGVLVGGTESRTDANIACY